MSQTKWNVLGEVGPKNLTEARLQAHWAVQIIPPVADVLLEKADDDSHSTMKWLPREKALFGHSLGDGDNACRVGLRLHDLTVLLAGPDGSVVDSLELEGKTVAEALDWCRALLSERLGRPVDAALRDYDMPEHALATGGTFAGAALRSELAELSMWFENTAAVLDLVYVDYPQASEVLCWPHHFDIATLIEFDENAKPDVARSIGVGMSPGDNSYDEPYLYVSHSPKAGPDITRLGLSSGEWTRFGAGLRGSVIVHAEGAEAQQQVASHFVTSAIKASRALIGV